MKCKNEKDEKEKSELSKYGWVKRIGHSYPMYRNERGHILLPWFSNVRCEPRGDWFAFSNSDDVTPYYKLLSDEEKEILGEIDVGKFWELPLNSKPITIPQLAYETALRVAKEILESKEYVEFQPIVVRTTGEIEIHVFKYKREPQRGEEALNVVFNALYSDPILTKEDSIRYISAVKRFFLSGKYWLTHRDNNHKNISLIVNDIKERTKRLQARVRRFEEIVKKITPEKSEEEKEKNRNEKINQVVDIVLNWHWWREEFDRYIAEEIIREEQIPRIRKKIKKSLKSFIKRVITAYEKGAGEERDVEEWARFFRNVGCSVQTFSELIDRPRRIQCRIYVGKRKKYLYLDDVPINFDFGGV